MLEIIATEGGEKNIRLNLKLSVILSALVIVGVAAVVYLSVSAANWVYQNAGELKNGNGGYLQSLNPLNKIKDYLKSGQAKKDGGQEANQTKETIKIVDEQSQVIKVVEKASSAVVSIVASAEVPKLEKCYGGIEFFEDIPDEFKDFFDAPMGYCKKGTEIVKVGAGTGFLASSDGYIITNKHVVSKKEAEYTVILNDKKNLHKKVKAQVLALDPDNDLAVLKIEMKDLPHVTFADSDKLKVGQTAIAIGYALGKFDNTVSKGVVSGLSRDIQAMGEGYKMQDLRGLIQTDAAINFGNSGGPLLDLDGDVIGVNVATANAQNIGFAVPGNLAKKAFAEVKANGKISKAKLPFLGVRYMPITAELKQKYSLPYDYGMLIIRGNNPTDLAVIPGSPANKAGISENDLILEIESQKLDENNLLSDAIRKFKIGDEIKLKVYSKGKVVEVKLKLEERP